MTQPLLPPVDPWAWRSNMDAPQPSPLATLKPGPAPTGSDRVFDALYGYLGGTPDQRSKASALSDLFNVGTMGAAAGGQDTALPVAAPMSDMDEYKRLMALRQMEQDNAESGYQDRPAHPSMSNHPRYDAVTSGLQALGYGGIAAAAMLDPTFVARGLVAPAAGGIAALNGLSSAYNISQLYGRHPQQIEQQRVQDELDMARDTMPNQRRQR